MRVFKTHNPPLQQETIKMLIIPAIDIKDGCVVRLVRGQGEKKVYSRDPLKTARHWIKQGAEFIHIVDLDAASSGKLKNLESVKHIVKNIQIPVQYGGGVRGIETIKSLLKIGIRRVVLGTQAAEDKNFLQKAFKKFKDRVIVSIDAKAENVMVNGWRTSVRRIKVLDFAQSLKKIGFKDLIYTDTIKDGTLTGPNIKGIKALLKASKMRMIASGGISSLDDIFRLKLLEKQGLIGIIVGKALYEGRFTLSEALRFS